MLTDDAPEARALFRPGVELDVFATPQELRRQCERYLADPAQRGPIADAGHQRAIGMPDFSLAARVLIGWVAGAPRPPARDDARP